MKSFLKIAFTAAAMSAIAIAPTFLGATAASALPTGGMSGSYLGGGVSVGVTGESGEDDTTVGGNVQSRFDVPIAPVSVRGALLVGGESAALMPIVSYDLPVAPNTNLYAGAGYSFVLDEGQETPLGNQNAVVLTAGVETALARNIALYGDVKLGIDAFKDSSDSAVSLQVGAAYRF